MLPRFFPSFSRGTGVAVAVCTLVALVACGGGNTQGRVKAPANPEKQSDAEYDLARDDFYKNHPRTALEHALRACELNEDNSQALKFTSEIYVYFCDTEGERAPDCHLDLAEKFARRAVDSDERFLDARNTLGSILILEKKYPEAIKVLRPLVENPTYEFPHLAWGNIGWAQVLAGRYDEGLASLEHAVTNPSFCVGHYRMGIAFERKGDYSQAEQSFTQALSVERPDCQSLQDAWEGRGRVRVRLGKIAEARADFERCRDLSGESVTGKMCTQQLAARITKPAGGIAPPSSALQGKEPQAVPSGAANPH
jgi:Tfp pilus assembly protein PilF